MKKMTRRIFVKTAAVGAAGTAALAYLASLWFKKPPELVKEEAEAPSTLLAEDKKKTDVWVFEGKDKGALMAACMKTIFENGGFGPNVKKLGFKPNAAFNRTPDEGAGTHPELVEGFLKAVTEKGFKDIIVPERFTTKKGKAKLPERNEVGPVLKKYDVKLIPTKDENTSFKTITIPNAVSLKTVEVCSELLEVDAVVNMPVSKHHKGATLTMATKNWMGVVKDPRWWHENNLHQCIADFALFMKPTWTIVDATRCMTDKGPQGPCPPEKMIHPNKLIVSKDQIAADCVTSLIFPAHESPYEVEYLELARDMGAGETEISNMNIHEIKV